MANLRMTVSMNVGQLPLWVLAPLSLPEPLTFDIPCVSSGSTEDDNTHPITINTDGTVTTPHDFEAERVAVALGAAPTSCLTLEKSMLSARRIMLLKMRAHDLRMSRDWSLHTRCRECDRVKYPSAALAAAHERSPRHQAGWEGGTQWQIALLVNHLTAALGEFAAPPPHDIDRLLLEPDGADQLWHSGVHPNRVIEIARAVGLLDRQMPYWFYRAVACSGADLAWLAELRDVWTVDDACDRLAWGPQWDVRPRIASWVEFGALPQPEIVERLLVHTSPDRVRLFMDTEPMAPRAPVVDALLADLGPLAEHVTRFDAALVLATAINHKRALPVLQRAATHIAANPECSLLEALDLTTEKEVLK